MAVAVGVGPGGEQPLSRQVFIVQELEVRDRLASSQINKFLYLHTSESMPRRAHSNMVRQQRAGRRSGTESLIYRPLKSLVLEGFSFATALKQFRAFLCREAGRIRWRA